MRLLVCPDAFGGTLTAVAAADAIATGWLRKFPATEVVQQPLSDGGPGFLSAISAGLPGNWRELEVTDLHGRQRTARWFEADGTAYIEAAQTCGLHLADLPLQPMSATSRGVGELVAAAVATGCRHIVVGVGGTGSVDGGAGILAALSGSDSDPLLSGGAIGLAGLSSVNLTAALDSLDGIDLEIATDVEVPLTGTRGAAYGFGPQKGVTADELPVLEQALSDFARMVGRRSDGRDPAVMLGAGAGGGIGFMLMALGGRRVAGIQRVMEIVDFAGQVAAADLVVTGEGKLDWQSEQGKVVAGVARAAGLAAKPVIALAGQVELSTRECQALGLHGAYSVSERYGLAESLAEPAARLSDLGERVARTWGRG